MRASGLDATVRRLQRDVAELRSRLDALGGAPSEADRIPRHSKEKLAWAKRHGVPLDELQPFEAPALGTHTMTVAEAARELALSLEQVRRHLRTGRLRGAALGGRAGWRVSRADVARFRVEREALTAGRRSSVQR
jgi:excisionase family DNA binding protein